MTLTQELIEQHALTAEGLAQRYVPDPSETPRPGWPLSDWEIDRIDSGCRTQARFDFRKQPHPYDTENREGAWAVSAGYSRSHLNIAGAQLFERGKYIGSVEYVLPLNMWLMQFAPYQPGEVVWGRESYWDHPSVDHVRYNHDLDDHERQVLKASGWMRRSSMTMKEPMSRRWFEIDSVIPQRVCDITGVDAVLEGCERVNQVGAMRAVGWKDYLGGQGYLDPAVSCRSLFFAGKGFLPIEVEFKRDLTSEDYTWAIQFHQIERPSR